MATSKNPDKTPFGTNGKPFRERNFGGKDLSVKAKQGQNRALIEAQKRGARNG